MEPDSLRSLAALWFYDHWKFADIILRNCTYGTSLPPDCPQSGSCLFYRSLKILRSSWLVLTYSCNVYQWWSSSAMRLELIDDLRYFRSRWQRQLYCSSLISDRLGFMWITWCRDSSCCRHLAQMKCWPTAPNGRTVANGVYFVTDFQLLRY